MPASHFNLNASPFFFGGVPRPGVLRWCTASPVLQRVLPHRRSVPGNISGYSVWQLFPNVRRIIKAVEDHTRDCLGCLSSMYIT